MDEKVSLFGPLSVIGRAFVVRLKQVQLDVQAGSCSKGSLNPSLRTLVVSKPFSSQFLPYFRNTNNYWVQVFFAQKGFCFIIL